MPAVGRRRAHPWGRYCPITPKAAVTARAAPAFAARPLTMPTLAPADALDTAFAPPDGPAAARHERYLANLAALWQTDAALARRVEGLDFDTPAEALASAPDADAEPAGRLDGVDPTEQFAFVVHGLGPHVPALFDLAGRADGEAIFLIFEPSLTRIRDELVRRHYAELLASRRALVFTSADPVELGQRLTPLTAMVALGLTTIAHRPSVERDPAFFEAARRAVADFVTLTNTNVATAIQYGRKTTFNVLDNLVAYAASPDLSRLKGVYGGKPAVIVSAGPSLQRNIGQLRDAAGRAVVIAVQTTLRPLLEAGVVPDFVTALDHHEISSRFYENLPPDLATELVAEPKVSRKVLDAWLSVPGRKLTLLGNDTAESLLRELRLNKTGLPAGATVAHLAFSLAEHLGCATAILVGQDLGFSDGLAYTPGTSYDDVWRPETGRFGTFEMKQWEHIARDRAALRRVADWRGVPTYTEQRLFSYLQQFERMFAETPMRVIDASEGGVAKAHTERMTLAAALAEYCHEAAGRPPAFPSASPAATERVGRSLAERQGEAAEIAAIGEKTLSLLRVAREHMDDQPRVNGLIAEIDRLRRELRGLEGTYRLVLTLAQRSEQERYRADRRIRAVMADDRQRQRRQVERDILNVESIRNAAQSLVEAISSWGTDTSVVPRLAA